MDINVWERHSKWRDYPYQSYFSITYGQICLENGLFYCRIDKWECWDCWLWKWLNVGFNLISVTFNLDFFVNFKLNKKTILLASGEKKYPKELFLFAVKTRLTIFLAVKINQMKMKNVCTILNSMLFYQNVENVFIFLRFFMTKVLIKYIIVCRLVINYY